MKHEIIFEVFCILLVFVSLVFLLITQISQVIAFSPIAKEDMLKKELCEGCLEDGRCENYGEVINGKFCDDSKQFLEQKSDGSYCTNPYECKSRNCYESICHRSSFIKRMLVFLSQLLFL